jgi:hypothetical protein
MANSRILLRDAAQPAIKRIKGGACAAGTACEMTFGGLEQV